MNPQSLKGTSQIILQIRKKVDKSEFPFMMNI